MKEKISITVDKETLAEIERAIAAGIFRNRSHAVEFAVKQLTEKGEENGRR